MLEKQRKRKKQKSNEIDIFKNIPKLSNILVPDSLQEFSDYTYLGHNKYSRQFAITVYPEQCWIGWLDDISRIGDVNISIKIENSSNASVINQLTKKLVQNQSQYQTYQKQGNIAHLPELEQVISDLEELRTLIQTNRDKLFYVTIFIKINAKTKEELDEKTLLIESEFAKKTAMIRCLTFRQVEAWKNILPLGEKPVADFERNMVTGGIATLIPVASPDLSHDTGIFVGRNIFTNAPVYIDTFIGPPMLPNPHTFICGTSGGGKSVALKLLSARNMITNNTNIFFLDVEGEYAKLCKQLGGKVIKIRQRRNSWYKSI